MGTEVLPSKKNPRKRTTRSDFDESIPKGEQEQNHFPVSETKLSIVETPPALQGDADECFKLSERPANAATRRAEEAE